MNLFCAFFLIFVEFISKKLDKKLFDVTKLFDT